MDIHAYTLLFALYLRVCEFVLDSIYLAMQRPLVAPIADFVYMDEPRRMGHLSSLFCIVALLTFSIGCQALDGNRDCIYLPDFDFLWPAGCA